MIRKWCFVLLASTGAEAALASATGTATVEVPVVLDYRILQQALQEQVFTGPQSTLEVYADRLRCNTMTLSDPRIDGTVKGRIRMLSTMQARTGAPLGDKCRLAKTWHGLIETIQVARIEPQSARVAFAVVESTLLRPDDRQPVFPRFLNRWINDYLHPRLRAVTIDLDPALSGLEEMLELMVYDPRAEPGVEAPAPLSSPSLAAVRPEAGGLVAVLSLQVAPAPGVRAPTAAAPLTAEELASWDDAWQAWDGFATWLIKTLALTARPELIEALAETLIEARYDLRDALARDDRDRDPVRALFLKTWERLAPLMHEVQLDLPGSRAWPFATFISAADALKAVDQLAPHLGMRLDRHTLRDLARVLVPGISDYDLRYDTAVDPDLRRLLGLDPELEMVDMEDSILAWLIPNAYAAQIDPELVRRLNGWVPNRKDVDDYLMTVERLLNAIEEAERDRGKVPDRHLELYATLLRATAWQESCWRQYVQREGSLETIRSSAGSVGMMQINVHVWRGVYDLDALHTDVGYNARAGNEILVHYLVDYAIRRKEDEITGSSDNLARATYAVYNGGPRHLKRYRNPGTSASLKKIDSAFWRKYQTIRDEGPLAVKQCLGG